MRADTLRKLASSTFPNLAKRVLVEILNTKSMVEQDSVSSFDTTGD